MAGSKIFHKKNKTAAPIVIYGNFSKTKLIINSVILSKIDGIQSNIFLNKFLYQYHHNKIHIFVNTVNTLSPQVLPKD